MLCVPWPVSNKIKMVLYHSKIGPMRSLLQFYLISFALKRSLLSNLNSRLQSLIAKFCHRLDFTSVSKKNFNIVFQNQDTNQRQSLKLSDDKYTSGQVNSFFESYTFTDNFSQLQYLSIVKMNLDDPYPIFAQLPSLSNLISLEVESICGENIPEIELSDLKKLNFGSCPSTN